MSLSSLVLILFPAVTLKESHTSSTWQLYSLCQMHRFLSPHMAAARVLSIMVERVIIISLLSMFLCPVSPNLSSLLLPDFSSPNWVTFSQFKFTCWICTWASAAACTAPCSPLLALTCSASLSCCSAHCIFMPGTRHICSHWMRCQEYLVISCILVFTVPYSSFSGTFPHLTLCVQMGFIYIFGKGQTAYRPTTLSFFFWSHFEGSNFRQSSERLFFRNTFKL